MPGEKRERAPADLADGDEIVLLRDVSRVLDGVFVGSMDAEASLQVLQQLGITHILTVAVGLEPSHPAAFIYQATPTTAPPASMSSSVNQLRGGVLQRVPVADDLHAQLLPHLESCFDFIENARENGGTVLVHCEAGVSRSATVVIGFLMCRLGKSLEEAINHVKMVRPCVKPNVNFMQQLQMLELADACVGTYPPYGSNPCVKHWEMCAQSGDCIRRLNPALSQTFISVAIPGEGT